MFCKGYGYEKFDVYIGVNSKEYEVNVAINNQLKLSINVSYWSNYTNFFKSGNYIQDMKPNRWLTVHNYCLQISLQGEYDCVLTPYA